jgi:hypothetical protein
MELEQAREDLIHVYENRLNAGITSGVWKDTPADNAIAFGQWKLCLDAARNALSASQDPTQGALYFNMRPASMVNAATAPRVGCGSVLMTFGPFLNTAGGDVPRGPVLLNIYGGR